MAAGGSACAKPGRTSKLLTLQQSGKAAQLPPEMNTFPLLLGHLERVCLEWLWRLPNVDLDNAADSNIPSGQHDKKIMFDLLPAT